MVGENARYRLYMEEAWIIPCHYSVLPAPPEVTLSTELTGFCAPLGVVPKGKDKTSMPPSHMGHET